MKDFVLEFTKDCNVITVPNKVTLSRLLEVLKISGHYVDGLHVERDWKTFDDKYIFIMNYDVVVVSIFNGEIFNINWFPIFDIFKPLYVYWIARTEIIDDLI